MYNSQSGRLEQDSIRRTFPALTSLSTMETLRAACFTPCHSHYAAASACNHAHNNMVATDSTMSNNGGLKQEGAAASRRSAVQCHKELMVTQK